MKNLNLIIKNLVLSMIILFLAICAFLIGAIFASSLDFFGNPKAIKLLDIDFIESLRLYFHFNLNSYLSGFVFLISVFILCLSTLNEKFNKFCSKIG